MGDDPSSDEQHDSNTRSSRTLTEETAALRHENADLKEQLRLTTQQLSEAMAALGRAMEYIQLTAGTGADGESSSDGLLSEINGVRVSYCNCALTLPTEYLTLSRCLYRLSRKAMRLFRVVLVPQ